MKQIMRLRYLIIVILIFNIGCDTPKDINHEITVSSDFQSGQQSYSNGDYNQSIEHYTTLINKYSEVDELYIKRGDAYRESGDTANAIADYSQAIDKNGSVKGQALLRTGLIYFYSDDLKNAEIIFSKITETDLARSSPEVWSAYYHLGQIAYKTSQFKSAINFYNKADTSYATLLTNYHKANAFFSLGLLDSARINFNKSIKFVKNDFVRAYPTSAIAQCDTCGFPFGSKEYELLTIPTKEGFKNAMQKLQSNKVYQDVMNHPEKYLDTNYIKQNKDIHLIK